MKALPEERELRGHRFAHVVPLTTHAVLFVDREHRIEWVNPGYL
jgi:hypothetical protein